MPLANRGFQPADSTWVARAGGAVIGDSDQALEVAQDGEASVIYFPREDVAMAFLEMPRPRSPEGSGRDPASASSPRAR